MDLSALDPKVRTDGTVVYDAKSTIFNKAPT
jgi:hypothetical protein